MAGPTASTARTWQDIARELANETNRGRVLELAEELNRALEEQCPNGLREDRPEQ